jgi:hypothetical protein
MIYIKHRVNSQSDLVNLDKVNGVEIDLRLQNGKIVLAHDPYTSGEEFESWIESYNHNILILNTKEDGLEFQILEILKKHNIKRYFFLDQPFPTQNKCLLENIPTAIRISDLEPVEVLRNFKPEWIWLDNFSGNWDIVFGNISRINYDLPKICLVSPELQNRVLEQEAPHMVELISSYKIEITAICTKFPENWRLYFDS